MTARNDESVKGTSSIVGLKVCNNFQGELRVALGTDDPDDFHTAGWWSIAPGTCQVLVDHSVANSHVYIEATSADNSIELKGRTKVCLPEYNFELIGFPICDGSNEKWFTDMGTSPAPARTIILE